MEDNILDKIISSSVQTDVSSNSILNDRYICTKILGKGGLCNVYEAKDNYNNIFKNASRVAIKMPNNEMIKMKDITVLIYMEFRMLLKLKHKNIIRAMDFGIDKKTNYPYLVLEKLDGKLLENISLDSFSKKEIKNFFFSFNETLKFIHKNGIIHADISPNNIIIQDNGEFCIFDFGLSQMNHKLNFSFEKFRAFQDIYVAPEILKGEAPSKESDIFSMAVIFYELFTKELPFEKSSLELYHQSISYKKLSKIPFGLKKWFKNSLNISKEKRRLY